MPKESRFEPDPETGVVYRLVPEGPLAICCAILSGVYLLLALAFFAWLLFDVWIGRFTVAQCLDYGPIKERMTPAIMNFMYAFIGGGLGATSNEFRSFLVWHAERSAFGPRFIWKSIFAPWIGAILALFVIALVDSGVAMLGAEFTGEEASTRQALSMFALGALTGYGSLQVSRWIDAQVKRIFSTESAALKTPTLIGETLEVATGILKAANLRLGGVSDEHHVAADQVGKVVEQSPTPGSPIAVAGEVNVRVGRQ